MGLHLDDRGSLPADAVPHLSDTHRRVVSEGGATPPSFFVFAVLAILAAVMPLLPGVQGGFVFDDFGNFVGQPAFSAPLDSLERWWVGTLSSASTPLGRPLAMFTLLVNFHLAGLDPLPFKLTNVLLHAANGVLLYLLILRLCAHRAFAGELGGLCARAPLFALIVAIAWTTLAIHVSTVLLLVQRMEVLANLFVLAGLNLYVSGRLRQLEGRAGARRRLLAALTLVPAAGVLAKETAIMLPAYALALEVFLFRFEADRDRRFLLGLHAGLATAGVMAACWLLPAFLAMPWDHRAFTLPERLLTEAGVLWQYARWILLPDLMTMGLYHDDWPISRSLVDPPGTAVAVAAWVAVFALLVRLARRPSIFGLGLSWYLLGHMLTATVLPLELVFEHRNYFASIGLCLCVVAIVGRAWRLPRARNWLLLAVGVWGFSQAAATAIRSGEWSDPLRHAQAEAVRNPGSPRAQYQFGSELLKHVGQDVGGEAWREAVERFELAAGLPGASALPLQALLVTHSSTRQALRDEWWEGLKTHVRERRLDYQTVAALQRLSQCQVEGACRFPDQQLAEVFAIAANREPQDAEVLTVYAHLAALRWNDQALALELLRRARELDPANVVRWYQEGQTLALQGRHAEARIALEQMRRLDRLGLRRTEIASLERLIEELERYRDGAAPPPAG